MSFNECVFPTVVDWRTNASKDGMPANGTYSVEAVRALDTHRTSIQKQPEMLLCLVEIDLFSLIRAPNPTKVKTGSRPRAPHEVPLLTLTAARVIEMDEPATATDSSGVPSAVEKSPLDFAHEDGASDQGTTAPEVPPPEDVPATAAPEGSRWPSTLRDLDSLCFADAPSHHPVNVAQSSQGVVAAGDPKSENVLPLLKLGLREVYTGQNEVSPMVAYSTPLRPARTWWTMLLPRVAMGSQLCLRFEQEAKLLRKSVAQVARRDQRIQARELEIKNLKALLETEACMKRAAEEKSAGLSQELERMQTLKAAFEEYKRQQDQLVEQRCAEMDACLDALSIDFDEELYPYMLTAIAGRKWVIGHGLRLAMMKCAESLEMRQAFADVVSAGVAKGMSEGLKHGVEHGHAQLTIESLEAYDPEAKAKFVVALQSLKDLKYPLLDQLEGLKDAPMDVIMAALYLKSDTRGDALQFIRDLHPSSSQLAIPVYPEVRDPRNPWAYKEEIKLSDAITANISRAEKKKKCRTVCRTHGVGSAHHARSDGVSVSVPTVVPQGLALLLVDAATQTDLEDA
nr:hypothetical protein [Tanacetum cinerariifolium]